MNNAFNNLCVGLKLCNHLDTEISQIWLINDSLSIISNLAMIVFKTALLCVIVIYRLKYYSL